MRKYCIILLTVCLFLGGCGAGHHADGEPDAESISEVTVLPENPAGIILAKNGKAHYRLIRAEDADRETVEIAVNFRRVFQEKTGIALEFGTDWVKPGTAPDMEAMEILIGVTNRTDEDTVSALGSRDWRIDADGNKILLLAKTPAALREAVDAFFTEQITVEEDNRVMLNHVPLTGTASLSAGEVPDFPFGRLEGFMRAPGVRL